MASDPSIIERSEQHYVGIRETITMQTFDVVAARIPHLFSWLDARGLTPDGAPFFKINVLDMERELQVEAGVPIAAATTPEGEVHCGVLPAGRYVAVTSTGSPDEHIATIADMFDWAKTQGLSFDKTDTDAGEKWGCRLLILTTDPAQEPDETMQEIDNLFRLAE